MKQMVARISKSMLLILVSTLNMLISKVVLPGARLFLLEMMMRMEMAMDPTVLAQLLVKSMALQSMHIL